MLDAFDKTFLFIGVNIPGISRRPSGNILDEDEMMATNLFK